MNMYIYIYIEKDQLKKQLTSLDIANNDYYENAVRIMELVRNAPLLFRKTTDLEEKRQILNLLFQNLELHDEVLLLKYKKPYDSMALLQKDSSWLGLVDVFQEEMPVEDLCLGYCNLISTFPRQS